MRSMLSARPPFSLSAVVRSHGWVRLAPFDGDTHTGGLVRVERLDSGRVIEMHIREAAGGVSAGVDGPLSVAERDEVVGKVEWMLGLGQDFSPFYALARQEP